MILIGLPTTTLLGATLCLITLDPPTTEFLPMVISPNIVEFAYIITLSSIVGCLLPLDSTEFDPNVTLCKITTFLPITAVCPMTTPAPWSINRPSPILAPG